MEGPTPRRPKAESNPDECDCCETSTDTDDGSNNYQEFVPHVLPEEEALVGAEAVSSVDQFIDAPECSGKRETSDESSLSEQMETSSMTVEVSEESWTVSEPMDASPMKTDRSSDLSPTKSAISDDSFLPKSDSSDTSDESVKPDSSPSSSNTDSPDVSPASTVSLPARLGRERTQAAAEVTGECGQSVSRRRTVLQPRDFSRERPAGVRHIRRAAKRVRRGKTANPKRQRQESPDIAE